MRSAPASLWLSGILAGPSDGEGTFPCDTRSVPLRSRRSLKFLSASSPGAMVFATRDRHDVPVEPKQEKLSEGQCRSRSCGYARSG